MCYVWMVCCMLRAYCAGIPELLCIVAVHVRLRAAPACVYVCMHVCFHCCAGIPELLCIVAVHVRLRAAPACVCMYVCILSLL
jgi:hypothetical protein